MLERLVGTTEREEDRALDTSLRPRRLDDYIGQDHVKENLKIVIEAARRRGEALPAIQVYRIGELHFVEDGHHRVSVARARGAVSIAAIVDAA